MLYKMDASNIISYLGVLLFCLVAVGFAAVAKKENTEQDVTCQCEIVTKDRSSLYNFGNVASYPKIPGLSCRRLHHQCKYDCDRYVSQQSSQSTPLLTWPNNDHEALGYKICAKYNKETKGIMISSYSTLLNCHKPGHHGRIVPKIGEWEDKLCCGFETLDKHNFGWFPKCNSELFAFGSKTAE